MSTPSQNMPDQDAEAQKRRWLSVMENFSPSELEGAFLRAVEKHDVIGVTALLEIKREFFTPDLGRGLQISAEKGMENLVELFLKKGADPDYMAGLPLRLAVENGHRDVAWALVKAGADEGRKEGYLVNLAAKAGQIEMMEWLFARGVRGDLMNALTSATMSGQEAAVDLVLEKIKPGEADGRAQSALYHAIEKGYDGIARKLIDRGFHKNGDVDMVFDAVVRRMDAPLLEFFLQHAPQPRLFLRRALLSAAEQGKADCVRVILNESVMAMQEISAPVGLKSEIAAIFNEAAGQSLAKATVTFDLLYGQGFTLESLRGKQADGTNGFLLSVLAGQWETVRSYIAAHPEEPLYVSDFLHENNLGRSVVSILGHQKNLSGLFDAKLWQGRSLDACAAVLRSVPLRFHADIDYQSVSADINRRIIDKKLSPRRRPGNNP